MNVTIHQIVTAGATMSRCYLGYRCNPIGSTVKRGFLESIFDSEDVIKTLENRIFKYEKSIRYSKKVHDKMNKVYLSIKKAIEKLEDANVCKTSS